VRCGAEAGVGVNAITAEAGVAHSKPAALFWLKICRGILRPAWALMPRERGDDESLIECCGGYVLAGHECRGGAQIRRCGNWGQEPMKDASMGNIHDRGLRLESPVR